MHPLHRYYSCKRKLRHDDYLSALCHASCLGDQNSLVIYPCEHCGGLHVGHGGKGESPRTYANTLEKWIARKQRKVRRLKSGRKKLSGDDLRRRDEQIKMVSEYVEGLKVRSADELETEVLKRKIKKTKKRIKRAVRAAAAVSEFDVGAQKAYENTARDLCTNLENLVSKLQALPNFVHTSY